MPATETSALTDKLKLTISSSPQIFFHIGYLLRKLLLQVWIARMARIKNMFLIFQVGHELHAVFVFIRPHAELYPADALDVLSPLMWGEAGGEDVLDIILTRCRQDHGLASVTIAQVVSVEGCFRSHGLDL